MTHIGPAIFVLVLTFRRYILDMGRDKAMYQAWWRLLESADEYQPGRIWWPYYGLGLDAATLKSLYRETALKALNFK